MDDREFDRLDGQIHAKNDATHAVDELPMRNIPEHSDYTEASSAGETGAGRYAYEWKAATASEKKTSTAQSSTVKMAASTTVATPIIAALATVVSAVLIVTSAISSISVKVSLQAKTAFSLIFSLVIQNPENTPLLATLSAEDQEPQERFLETQGEEDEKAVELVFENLLPNTKYTLLIRNPENGKTLFEKYYYTLREEEDSVRYTVTEEEWLAALAAERFRNVTVRITSSEGSGQGENGKWEQTYVAVYDGDRVLTYSHDSVSLTERSGDNGDLWLLSYLAQIPFGEFTYDEAAKLYRYAQADDRGRDQPQGKDSFEESFRTVYTLSFQDGYLTAAEQTQENTYGEETWSYTQRYAFEGYGTSFITTETVNGICYVQSTANDTWIAYGQVPEQEPEQDPYPVTEEQWNAALASEAFENVTIRQIEASAGGQQEDSWYSESTTVCANGKTLRLESDWVSVWETPEGTADFEEFLWLIRELSERDYADFTFDEANHQYRYVEEIAEEGEETVTQYTVEFRDGKLTFAEYTYAYSGDWGENSSSTICIFEGYGTSFITTETVDGIGYVRSSANDTWIAYERQDWEQTDLVVATEIDGIAVTQISSYTINSQGISTVTLPATLTSIGSNFDNCDDLSAIYFAGTREQWNLVTVNSDGYVTVSPDLPVYFYSEARPDESPSDYWYYGSDGLPVRWR